jgi:hypothetical protein
MKKTFDKSIAFDRQLIRNILNISKLCLLLLTSSIISLHASNFNPQCANPLFKGHFVKGGVYNAKEFGLLFEGSIISDSLKHINTSTIQMVLDSVGIHGGGTVFIPAGIYCITAEAGGSCLNINYDNIILQGAGMTKTRICTRNKWDTTKNARASGITIHGTQDIYAPRKNITLEDFELDGGAGWTGNYVWTPPETSGQNGWDITHHGINLCNDNVVDSITLKNLYVHSYRGEILYAGGLRSGRVVVKGCKMGDTNASDFNLYGGVLLADSTEFCGPTRFWIELCARSNQMNYPGNKCSFTNCVFKNAIGAQGIAIAQGDNTPWSITFSHNTFSDDPKGLFIFTGGIAGPVTITDNKIINCGGDYTKREGDIIDFQWGGDEDHLKDDHLVKDITFANNIVEKSGDFISFEGSWDGKPMVVENLKIHNNIFSGKNPSSPCATHSVIYGESRSWWNKSLNNCQMSNIEIYDNIFNDCAPPEQIGKVLGTRPFFARNKYINTCDTMNCNLNLNKNIPIISPKYEDVVVSTTEDMLIVKMDTSNYSNNQYVKITGGDAKHKIEFVTNANTYKVKKEVVLNGKKELWLRFDSIQRKWLETKKPEI